MIAICSRAQVMPRAYCAPRSGPTTCPGSMWNLDVWLCWLTRCRIVGSLLNNRLSITCLRTCLRSMPRPGVETPPRWCPLFALWHFAVSSSLSTVCKNFDDSYSSTSPQHHILPGQLLIIHHGRRRTGTSNLRLLPGHGLRD